MQVTIPDDAGLQNQAIAAGFATIEDYLVELIERDAARVAIQQGIDDYKAGRTQSFDQFDAELRREFGFEPRT